MNAAKIGEDVLITAQVLKQGRTLAFATVDLTNKATGKLIAQGRHTKHLGGSWTVFVFGNHHYLLCLTSSKKECTCKWGFVQLITITSSTINYTGQSSVYVALYWNMLSNTDFRTNRKPRSWMPHIFSTEHTDTRRKIICTMYFFNFFTRKPAKTQITKWWARQKIVWILVNLEIKLVLFQEFLLG